MQLARVLALFPPAFLLVAHLAAAPEPAGAGIAIVYTVTKVEDELDGACDDGDCSLRDAFNEANTDGSESFVTIPNLGTAGPDIFSPAGGTYALVVSETQELTVDGAGAATTIIDLLDARGGLSVSCACAVSLSDFAIRNGRVDGGALGVLGVGVANSCEHYADERRRVRPRGAWGAVSDSV